MLSDAQRQAARDELGLPAGRPLLVHFGWDWLRKGGDVFEAALRMLRDSGADLTGVTVGGGDAARELRARLGLDGDLTVLEPTDKVQQMYAAADVFVAPSRAEGTPYSVLEAVSSGTAAVVSDIPGHATIGAHAPACVITPLEAAPIAAAIRGLLERDPARGGRGLARRARLAAGAPGPRPVGGGDGRPLRRAAALALRRAGTRPRAGSRPPACGSARARRPTRSGRRAGPGRRPGA